MSIKKREYTDYLKDIFDSINDIESFISGMSFEDFKKDKKTNTKKSLGKRYLE